MQAWCPVMASLHTNTSCASRRAQTHLQIQNTATWHRWETHWHCSWPNNKSTYTQTTPANLAPASKDGGSAGIMNQSLHDLIFQWVIYNTWYGTAVTDHRHEPSEKRLTAHNSTHWNFKALFFLQWNCYRRGPRPSKVNSADLEIEGKMEEGTVNEYIVVYRNMRNHWYQTWDSRDLLEIHSCICCRACMQKTNFGQGWKCIEWQNDANPSSPPPPPNSSTNIPKEKKRAHVLVTGHI